MHNRLIYLLSLSFIYEFYYYLINTLIKKIFGEKTFNRVLRFKDFLSYFILLNHIIFILLILFKFIDSTNRGFLFLIFGIIGLVNIYNSKKFNSEKRDILLGKLSYLARNHKLYFIIVYSILPILILLAIYL